MDYVVLERRDYIVLVPLAVTGTTRLTKGKRDITWLTKGNWCRTWLTYLVTWRVNEVEQGYYMVNVG